MHPLNQTDNAKSFPPREDSQAQAKGTCSSKLYVVGIGASAGGLEALEAFFDQMPADSGLSFVVIQHLSPDFKSLMDELLRRHTQLAIHRVEDGMTIEPNAIYLIPPKKEMIISGGRLLLTDKDPSQSFTLPIDTFFRSLAQEVRECSVGIILSGTGSDGSRGIRDISEAGGLVIAQSVESARFDGMPKSAIDTGVVDFVLAPQQMPEVLLSYVLQPGDRDRIEAPSARTMPQDSMNAIFQILRAEYGIDFSHYKPSTVGRRVDRRLQLTRSLGVGEYLEQLRNDPAELNLLYKDLLIGVTQFFRDRDAFDRLEREVLPTVLSRIPSEQEVRMWVAGCATGEEAYSLAILVHEYFAASKRAPNVKIFATDVHRASLETASAGIYSEASLREVTPHRLERYFHRLGSGYQVAQELRKLIVFAPHDIVKDAPFTRLDLISCRNLLIYLQPLAQKKALSLFHFGLKAGGVLVLGPSESPGDISEEFEPLDQHWKIYRKRRDVRLPADVRLPMARGVNVGRNGQQMHALGFNNITDTQLLRAYDGLLDRFIPAGVLINDRRELVHTFAGAGEFLALHDGRPTTNILELVAPELKVALAGALNRLTKENQPVVYSGIRLANGPQQGQVTLTAERVVSRGAPTGFTLISFETASSPALPESLPRGESNSDTHRIDMGTASKERMSALETELQYTQENLQATIEELETSNEELQATNEELLASNEELQSTNEELHSVNEELYTVNAEYQRKIGELTELTGDMENLLRSTEVAIIFVDRNLCIRKFTPKIAEQFNLEPQDIGRRIDSFAHKLAHDDLLGEVRRVLDTEEVYEKEVRDKAGKWHLLRIRPYRQKSQVDGVVITLVDVSILKKAEQDIRLLSKVFIEGGDAIVVEDLAGLILNANPEAERAYGWPRAELLGQHVSMLSPVDQHDIGKKLRQRCLKAERIGNVEVRRRTKSGETIPVLLTLSLLTSDEGEPVAVVSIAKDMSLQKQAEEERERYASELEQMNDSLRHNVKEREKAESQTREALHRRDHFLAMLSHELRNPLSAVLSATYLFDFAASDPQVVQEASDVIRRQATQMARLLDDLLDISRLTQGKIEIRPQVVDLCRIVKDATQSVRTAVDERQHALTLHLPEEPLHVEGDPARLTQIHENLLMNAAKYTPRGGAITVSVERDRHDAVVRVRDNGVGIPKEMLEDVFELFMQSNATLDRSDGGMGVGLTLVRNLVHLHHGQVVAKSDGAGKGSEFTVRLPLTEKKAVPQSEIVLRSPTALGLRVVIVEDNDDSRRMLTKLLNLDGCEVKSANNGKAGLELILAEQPDIALVDIGLPKMNGYELAREVRSHATGAALYLVALTGYGREEDRIAVLEAGFNEHLVKPLRPDELSRILNLRQAKIQEK